MNRVELFDRFCLKFFEKVQDHLEEEGTKISGWHRNEFKHPMVSIGVYIANAFDHVSLYFSPKNGFDGDFIVDCFVDTLKMCDLQCHYSFEEQSKRPYFPDLLQGRGVYGSRTERAEELDGYFQTKLKKISKKSSYIHKTALLSIEEPVLVVNQGRKRFQFRYETEIDKWFEEVTSEQEIVKEKEKEFFTWLQESNDDIQMKSDKIILGNMKIAFWIRVNADGFLVKLGEFQYCDRNIENIIDVVKNDWLKLKEFYLFTQKLNSETTFNAKEFLFGRKKVKFEIRTRINEHHYTLILQDNVITEKTIEAIIEKAKQEWMTIYEKEKVRALL